MFYLTSPIFVLSHLDLSLTGLWPLEGLAQEHTSSRVKAEGQKVDPRGWSRSSQQASSLACVSISSTEKKKKIYEHIS